MSMLNALRWDGKPGHYEVYYLTLTDSRSGVGVWIRYTLLAPLPGAGAAPSASLWFLAMDPRRDGPVTIGRKATFAIEHLQARSDPFELRIGEATLSNDGIVGGFEDVSWDLRWAPCPRGYEHV